MHTSSKREGPPPLQNEDAPPVARQSVGMQSNGRVLQRKNASTAKVGHGQPRPRGCAKVAYWPTTPLSREQMLDAIGVTAQQDAAVMAIFRHYAAKELAPSQVWRTGTEGGRKWLVTSVRRAINTLTNCGALVRGERIHEGPNGRPEHTWRLSREKVST